MSEPSEAFLKLHGPMTISCGYGQDIEAYRIRKLREWEVWQSALTFAGLEEENAQLKAENKRYVNGALWRQLQRLQAELEQAKEAFRAGAEQFAIKSDQLAECRTRLATAEADTKRLDWLDANRLILDAVFRDRVPGWQSREAIDKAKGAQ